MGSTPDLRKPRFMARSEDVDDVTLEDPRPPPSAETNAATESSKRKTVMIFGRDQTPGQIANALNSERARQLTLIEERRREAATKDPDEA